MCRGRAHGRSESDGLDLEVGLETGHLLVVRVLDGEQDVVRAGWVVAVLQGEVEGVLVAVLGVDAVRSAHLEAVEEQVVLADLDLDGLLGVALDGGAFDRHRDLLLDCDGGRVEGHVGDLEFGVGVAGADRPLGRVARGDEGEKEESRGGDNFVHL